MPDQHIPSSTEIRVLREIADIAAKIVRLESEKQGLESFLMRLRQENKALRDVNRRNSVNRVLFEEFVLDLLDKQKGFSTSAAIYKAYTKTHSGHNESTFRSSLHRMKEKGLLKTAGRGRWVKALAIAA